MESFGPRGNFPVKVVHLQGWSSLTGSPETCRSMISKRSRFHRPTLLSSNQYFGRNANGLRRFDWKFCSIEHCRFLFLLDNSTVI